MQSTIKTMIDPADAVMLLIDHQSGLFQLVKDIDMPTLRHNVNALAKVRARHRARDSMKAGKRWGATRCGSGKGPVRT